MRAQHRGDCDVRHRGDCDLTRTSKYDEYWDSMKITTRLDRVSLRKTASGTDFSNRWTYRVSIVSGGRRGDGGRGGAAQGAGDAAGAGGSTGCEPIPRSEIGIYCRTTSASTAPCTSRRICCPTHCASQCAPCQPLLRAFFGWIRFAEAMAAEKERLRAPEVQRELGAHQVLRPYYWRAHCQTCNCQSCTAS